jgi:cell division septum initiation protein DivIVA
VKWLELGDQMDDVKPEIEPASDAMIAPMPAMPAVRKKRAAKKAAKKTAKRAKKVTKKVAKKAVKKAGKKKKKAKKSKR